MFHIFFSSHGDRAFNKTPQDIKQRIIEVFESLARDIFWYRRVKKLQGTENQYRLRVSRWRVLFTVRNKEMEILDIFLKKGDEDYLRRIS
ncbi:MAG: hypothetical protein AAB972_05230 [Patescibacteria group bacterium]